MRDKSNQESGDGKGGAVTTTKDQPALDGPVVTGRPAPLTDDDIRRLRERVANGAIAPSHSDAEVLATIDILRTRLEEAERERDAAEPAIVQLDGLRDLMECGHAGRYFDHDTKTCAFCELTAERAAHDETRRELETRAAEVRTIARGADTVEEGRAAAGPRPNIVLSLGSAQIVVDAEED